MLRRIETLFFRNCDTFGQFVENRRTAMQITFSCMARLLRITPAQMIDLEKGRCIPTDMTMLQELRDILRLDEESYREMLRLVEDLEETYEPIVYTRGSEEKTAGRNII